MPPKYRKYKKKAKKVAKAVKSYVDRKLDVATEDKHIYSGIASQTLNNTTQILAQHMTLPSQDLTQAGRVGSRIKIKYIRLNIEVRSSGATTIAAFARYNQLFRLMIVRFNNQNSGSLVTNGTNQGLFQTTIGGAGHAIAIVNPLTCKSSGDRGGSDKIYTVVRDQVKKMVPMYMAQELNAADTFGALTYFKMFKRYPKGLIVNFTNAADGAATAIQNNGHWFVAAIGNTVVDDAVSYNFAGHIDICYEDA